MDRSFTPAPEVRTLTISELRSDAPGDLKDITRSVDAALTDAQRTQSWLYFLYRYVQDVNRGFRAERPPRILADELRGPSRPPLAPVPDEPPAPAPAPEDAVGQPPAADTQPAPATQPPRTYAGTGGRRYASPHVAAVSSWWEKTKNGQYPVRGQHRMLKTLTAEELLMVAEVNRTDAERNLATAARMEALAAAVAAAGVATVGELDEETARTCWGVAA